MIIYENVFMKFILFHIIKQIRTGAMHSST